MTSFPRRLYFLFFCLVLSGCGGTSPPLGLVDRRPAVSLPGQHTSMIFDIGRSVENRVIECIVMGDGPETILYMASIHGNETAGTALLLDFIRYIQRNPRILNGKTLIFLPIANPDGFFRNIRYNVNGVDLNRNFATHNRIDSVQFGEFPLSEPESRAVRKAIQHFAPDRILSLHEPLDCIDFDGPARNLAHFLAGFTDLEVQKLGGRPGSLGSYAGEQLGIPTITLELPPEAATLQRAELWRRYGKLLFAMAFYLPPSHLGK